MYKVLQILKEEFRLAMAMMGEVSFRCCLIKLIIVFMN